MEAEVEVEIVKVMVDAEIVKVMVEIVKGTVNFTVPYGPGHIKLETGLGDFIQQPGHHPAQQGAAELDRGVGDRLVERREGEYGK